MRLKGAVRDAFAYKNYLSDYLGVPDTQIRMLINQAASRDAILEAFKSFKEDNRINVGDPIFIVFAGHGTQIEAPPGWETGGRHLIQALVPYDYCSTRGLEVPCIPDRTIGALLEDIAETKGNNIVSMILFMLLFFHAKWRRLLSLTAAMQGPVLEQESAVYVSVLLLLSPVLFIPRTLTEIFGILGTKFCILTHGSDTKVFTPISSLLPVALSNAPERSEDMANSLEP